MRMLPRALALGAVLLVLGCSSVPAEDRKPDDKKGVVIEIDNLKNTAPASWKEEAPANKMRYMQFKLPKVGDDKEDAELIIFKGLGGQGKDNINRWKGMFVMPAGKDVEEFGKVTEVKVGDAKGLY